MSNSYPDVWNESLRIAADDSAGADTPRGLRMLAYIQRIHHAVEGDGLLFAMETNDDERIRRAVEGFHYFGFPAVADLFDGLTRRREDDDYLDEMESELDRIFDASMLDVAVRTRLTENPEEFGIPNTFG